MELRNNEYLVSVPYPTTKAVSGEDRLTATKCLRDDVIERWKKAADVSGLGTLNLFIHIALLHSA